MHYGKVMIYTDMKNSLWRVKPEKASKKLVHYSWKKDDPKKVWNQVVREVKRLTR